MASTPKSGRSSRTTEVTRRGAHSLPSARERVALWQIEHGVRRAGAGAQHH